MKKIINKNTLFGFVIGGIIFSTFGVAANILYNATQISYEDTNVHSALEDLYETNLCLQNTFIIMYNVYRK